MMSMCFHLSSKYNRDVLCRLEKGIYFRSFDVCIVNMDSKQNIFTTRIDLTTSLTSFSRLSATCEILLLNISEQIIRK